MKLSPAMTAKVLSMAAPKSTPAKLCGRKPKMLPSRWSFTITVPIQVRSEANCREHWAKKMRRKHEQQAELNAAFIFSPYMMDGSGTMPVVVTLTHIGAKMDDDNLANAFKGVRDWIAATALGIDDGDSRVTWRYEQRRDNPGGVEVRIETRTEADA